MKVINAQVGGLNRYIRETMKKSRLAASMKDEEASQNMCHI